MFLNDYSFFYSFVCRYVYFAKLFSNIVTAYTIIFFQKFVSLVSFENLLNLANDAIYNYIYLNKFFFGKKSYINKYNYYFSMNKYYYSFNILFKTKKSKYK